MADPAVDLSKSWQQVVDRFILRPSNWEIIPFPPNYSDDMIEQLVRSTDTLRLGASLGPFGVFSQSQRLLLTNGKDGHFLGNCFSLGISKGIALETPVSFSATLGVRGNLYKGPGVVGTVRPEELTGEYITVSVGGPAAVRQFAGLTLIFLGVPSSVARALMRFVQTDGSPLSRAVKGMTSAMSLMTPAHGSQELSDLLRDLNNSKLMGVLHGETFKSGVAAASIAIARGFSRFRQVQVEIDWDMLCDPKRCVQM